MSATGSSTGIRKKDSFEKRIIDVLKSDEQEFIQSYKVTTVEKGSGGVVGLGETASGGTRDPPGNFLPTSGGEMKGPMGYVPLTVTIKNDASIDNDTINIGLEDGVTTAFSSYVLIEGATATDDLEAIVGDVFEGQRLFLQTKVGDTITIEDFSNNSTGNIITSDGNDIVVDSTTIPQIVTLLFDTAATPNSNVGGWRVVSRTAGDAGVLPPGNSVNDHLEWNGAAPWVAQQFLEFHTTGPFADSGFLRFPNDQIMLSQRNQLDDGNLELKIDSSDAFDFTESFNAPITLKWRAQHASAPDQVGTITQNSNVTGEMVLATPDGFSINIGGAPTATFAALAATGIEFFDFLDMSGNQIQDMTSIVYTGFSTDGKAITRFLSGSGGINYDLENSGAEHVFRVNGNPPTEVMAVRDLGLLIAPAKILTFDVTSGSQGSINKTQASTMDFLCNDSFEFDTGNDATPIIFYESGNDTDGLLAMNLSFNAESDVASTVREYANIKITIEDSANTLEDGSVRIAAMSNGVPDVGFYKANGLTVENEMFKPLRMATGDSLFVDTNFVDMNDLATPANPSAGTRRMFVDSGTGELSVRLSGGTTVSLEGAGAGAPPFDDNQDILQDNLDNTKVWRMTLDAINTGQTKTFSYVGGNTTTYTFQSVGGLMASLDLAQTWSQLQTYNANIDMNDNNIVDIQNLAGIDTGVGSFNIIFDAAEDNDSSFFDSGTLDRINVQSGGNNNWWWTPTQNVANANIFMNAAVADLDMNGNDILNAATLP